MTAKTNVKSAAVDCTVSAVPGSESPMTIDSAMHQGDLDARHSYKEINHREEIGSRKRNLGALLDDDLQCTALQEEEEDDHGFDSDDSRSKKPGRRPMAQDDCNDENEDPKVKRKIQNRAAQRAFRERKERYVKDLEKKIKYVQDSHIYSTTRLFNENQQLRSIVYTLELEINSLKGAPIENPNAAPIKKKYPNQSWLTNIGPSIPLPVINSFPPTPLAPLKIHPSLPVTFTNNNTKKSASIMPEEKKQRKQTEAPKSAKPLSFINGKEADIKPSKVVYKPANGRKSAKAKNDSASQQFTFAITTPATLRAHSNNDLVRKNAQIEAVQLYPATCRFDNNKQPDHMPHGTHSTATPVLSPHYTSSVSSSCCSPLVQEEEGDHDVQHSSDTDNNNIRNDMLLFDDIQETQEEGLNDILKQFFDPTGNLDLSVFNTDISNGWTL